MNYFDITHTLTYVLIYTDVYTNRLTSNTTPLLIILMGEGSATRELHNFKDRPQSNGESRGDFEIDVSLD